MLTLADAVSPLSLLRADGGSGCIVTRHHPGAVCHGEVPPTLLCCWQVSCCGVSPAMGRSHGIPPRTALTAGASRSSAPVGSPVSAGDPCCAPVIAGSPGAVLLLQGLPMLFYCCGVSPRRVSHYPAAVTGSGDGHSLLRALLALHSSSCLPVAVGSPPALWLLEGLLTFACYYGLLRYCGLSPLPQPPVLLLRATPGAVGLPRCYRPTTHTPTPGRRGPRLGCGPRGGRIRGMRSPAPAPHPHPPPWLFEVGEEMADGVLG